jgi:hypothetical protein
MQGNFGRAEKILGSFILVLARKFGNGSVIKFYEAWFSMWGVLLSLIT